MNGDTVDISVINKPDDLVGEQLSIVLRGEVWLSRLRGVELEGLADPLSEDVEGWVGLHNLGHGLLHEGLHARDPATKHTEEGEEGGDGRHWPWTGWYLWRLYARSNATMTPVGEG